MHEDPDPGTIAFQAILTKISTTPDGGWRLTLDVSANESQIVLLLAEFRDQILQFAAVPTN